MYRDDMKEQNCRVRNCCDMLVRCVSTIGILILLSAVFNNRAVADRSNSKNERLDQSVVKSTEMQEEGMMLTEQMKKNAFACDTDGVCSKSGITIKDLKAVLEVADLKEMKRAPSSSRNKVVYILKVKGGRCIIEPLDSAADISNDSTIVSVTVNTKSVKDVEHLDKRQLPTQKER